MPSSSSSFSGPAQNPGASSIYGQQLGLMLSNYGNLLGGYSQSQANIGARSAQIAGGYDQLTKGLPELAQQEYGVGAGDIQRSLVHAQGQNQQSLINAGLGNSSLLAQSNIAASRVASQEFGRLATDVYGQQIQARNQIGLARQAAEMQGLGMQSSLANSYLGNLAGYNFMPRVDLYGQSSRSNSNSFEGGGYGGGGGGHGGGGMGGSSPYDLWNSYGAPNNVGYAGGYINGSYNPYSGVAMPSPSGSGGYGSGSGGGISGSGPGFGGDPGDGADFTPGGDY